MKIRELYSDPSKWTRGTYARDDAGREVVSDSFRAASCWCLGGAIAYCYPDEEQNAIYAKLARYIKGKTVAPGSRLTQNDGWWVHNWNDAPLRTFAEVKALVEELDI